MRVADLWGLGFVVPALRPAAVIIGVSTRELNSGGYQVTNFYRSLRNSPEGRSVASDLSLTEQIQQVAETSSHLVRYRTRIRSPSTLFRRPAGKSALPVGPLGASISIVRKFAHATYALNERIDFFTSRDYFRYDLDGHELRALNHLVEVLSPPRSR